MQGRRTSSPGCLLTCPCKHSQLKQDHTSMSTGHNNTLDHVQGIRPCPCSLIRVFASLSKPLPPHLIFNLHPHFLEVWKDGDLFPHSAPSLLLFNV